MFSSGSARHYFFDGIAVVEFDRELSADVVSEVFIRLGTDEAFVPGMPRLLDLRRITLFPTLDELLNAQSSIVKAFGGRGMPSRGPGAVQYSAWVSTNAMVEPLMRLSNEVRNLANQRFSIERKIETRFFTDFDQAAAWLRAAK